MKFSFVLRKLAMKLLIQPTNVLIQACYGLRVNMDLSLFIILQFFFVTATFFLLGEVFVLTLSS